MTTSMQGQIVLITGGTSGIGKQTALGLAKLGAHVVITGRDQARAEAAAAELKAASGNSAIEYMTADLSSQAEIRRLAEDFTLRYRQLNVLINNVGGLYNTRRETADGIEATLAVNVLTPFLLTYLLLPVLKSSTPSRVINVMGGLPTTKLEMDNLQAEKSFRGLATYSRAKVVMMATSYELAQRLQGSGVTLNVAYPGAAATDMTRAMTPAMLPTSMRLMWPVFRLFMGNAKPERAARSSIYLASAPEVATMNGYYYDTNSKLAKWPAAVLDKNIRQQLWKTSVQLTDLAAVAV